MIILECLSAISKKARIIDYRHVQLLSWAVPPCVATFYAERERDKDYAVKTVKTALVFSLIGDPLNHDEDNDKDQIYIINKHVNKILLSLYLNSIEYLLGHQGMALRYQFDL